MYSYLPQGKSEATQGSKAVPRHSPRAKPEGNPKEQPCFQGRLQTCPWVSLSTQGTTQGKCFQPTSEDFLPFFRLLIIRISCRNTWRQSTYCKKKHNLNCIATPSVNRYLHLLLATHMENISKEVLFGIKANSQHCTFLITLKWAEELNVPLAGLPNQGLIKSTMQSIDFTKKNFLRGVLPASCQEQLRIAVTCRFNVEFVVCLFIYTVWTVSMCCQQLLSGLVWRNSVDVNPNSGSVKSRQLIGYIKV